MIIWGLREKVIEEAWAGYSPCASCGCTKSFHLVHTKTVFHLYYVPVLQFTKGRHCICDECGRGAALKRSEYKALLGEFRVKFKNREIPEDIVRRDYTPKKLKMWLVCLKLALSLLFAAYVFYIQPTIILFGMIPVALCTWGLITALQRYLYYKSVVGDNPNMME